MNWRDEVAIHPEVARPPEATEVQWHTPQPLPDGLLPVEAFRKAQNKCRTVAKRIDLACSQPGGRLLRPFFEFSGRIIQHAATYQTDDSRQSTSKAFCPCVVLRPFVYSGSFVMSRYGRGTSMMKAYNKSKNHFSSRGILKSGSGRVLNLPPSRKHPSSRPPVL